VLLLLNAIRYTLYSMNWLRAHRYTATLIAAAVFVVVGGILAKNKEGTVVLISGDTRNVSVGYPYYAPPAISPEVKPPEIADNASPRALFFGQKVKLEETPAISPEVKPPEVLAVTRNNSLDNQYALFFKALSNILSPVDKRTPEQKVLFDYGNQVGLAIRNFEDTHGNVTQVLRDFFDSRTDFAKIASIPEAADKYAQLTALIGGKNQSVSKESAMANVQGVVNDYAQLSVAIRNVPNVPPQVESANAKLSRGYSDVAQGLSLLTKTENEAQLLEAIKAYNADADEFIENYVYLIQLFSAYGVKFSANDPGSVFSFSFGGL